MGTANVILYAQWTVNPTYTVTYNGNTNTGGSVPVDASSPYVQGATVTVLGQGSLVKAGSTFTGWNTAANGSGTSQAAGSTFAMGTANVILYAQWTVNPTYTLTMTASPVAGGSATDVTLTSPYAAGTVVSISAAANGGYVFNGWTAPAGSFANASAAATTFTMPAQNVIVTANFEEEAFVPPSGLVLWLDAADYNASTGVWPDLSGYNNTVSGTNKPTKGASVLNGLPVVQFNGSSQYLDLDWLSLPNTNSMTIFLVQKSNSMSSSQTIFGHYQSSGSNGGLPCLGVSQADNEVYGFFDNRTNRVFYGGSTDPYLVTVQYKHSTGVTTPWINDAIGTIFTKSITLHWADTRIGRSAGTTTNYWNGYIAEMMIFDSAVDVAAVQQHLMDKYGL
jgi:uncharacterized repeat protein (TIGR02543 family)